MNDEKNAMKWSDARGKRWRDALVGLEKMLAPVDPPLLDALELDRPLRVADVGCGGGGTTLQIAMRAQAGSVVHAFDISPELIQAARARTGQLNHSSTPVSFSVADIETTEPTTVYDRVTSRFGTMFYQHPDAAFERLARWLAPGGRAVFAVWGPAEENPWASLVKETVAGVIDVPQVQNDAPGPFRYADEKVLLGLLGRAGFRSLTVRAWSGNLPIGGGLPASEAAQFALDSFSVGYPLRDAAPTAREAAHQELTKRYSAYQSGSVTLVPARVHIVSAERDPA